jgi:hypothetical protein
MAVAPIAGKLAARRAHVRGRQRLRIPGWWPVRAHSDVAIESDFESMVVRTARR